MKCPACGSTLSEHTVGALTVDICDTGCGGIFFDRFELSQVDEATETEGEALIRWAGITPSKKPDQSQRYRCPRCGMIMMRGLFKPQIPVTVDTCPQCAGVFVDHGELNSIRAAEGSDEERQLAARTFINSAFDDILKAHS